MNAPAAGQNLVIVGASGMVGGYALRYALDHPAVERVTAIGRKTLGISHPKLMDVLHRDFADCSALAAALSGQDAAVFCLGAYTGGRRTLSSARDACNGAKTQLQALVRRYGYGVPDLGRPQEQKERARCPGGPWDVFRVPFLFSTNGRPLSQTDRNRERHLVSRRTQSHQSTARIGRLANSRGVEGTV